MNSTIRRGHRNLLKVLIASSVFAAVPQQLQAAGMVVPIDSTAGNGLLQLPDAGLGYSFILPNTVLNVSDGFNIGQSAAVAGATGSGSIDVVLLGSNNTLAFNGASNLSGDVGATNAVANITFNGANKTVAFNGNVFADSFEFKADSLVTIASNKILDAPVTTNVNNQGNLLFLGNATIDNQIGGAGAALKSLTINGGTNTNVHLHVDVYAQNTNVNNGGTLSISNSHQFTGNLNITNASRLALAQAADPITVTGNFNLGANAILQLDMGHVLNAGLINATGNAVINPAAGIVVTQAPGFIPGGKAVIPIVVDTGGGGANLNNIPVSSDSLLSNISTRITNNTLELVVIPVSLQTVFVTATNTGSCNFNRVGMITAIDQITSYPVLSGAMLDIVNQLGTFSDQKTICHALKMLSPIVDSAVLQESFENQDHSFDILSARINKINFCKAFPEHYSCRNNDVGVGAGDFGNPDGGYWMKTFRHSASQDARQGEEGYDNTAWGIAVGGDLLFSKRMLAGASFSWAHMDIDHEISISDTHANSYQLSLYGSYEFKSPLFFTWGAALAYNDYGTDRNVSFGNLMLATTGRYHGWQSGAKAEFSYDYRYVKYFDDYFHIQPMISLFYSHLDLSSYTEKGLNTANQQIDSAEFNVLKGGVGVKYIYDLPYHSILYQPEAHIRVFYDFIGDPMELTSQFVSAGPSFYTRGYNPARASINLGLGMTAYSYIGFYLTANYDYLAKNEYHANTGFLNLRYEW